MPNLGYWLSWIPFGAGLRGLFSRNCCTAFPWEKASFQPADRAIGVESARAARIDAVSAPQPAADFLSLVLQTVSNRDRKVDMQALTMAALGMSDKGNTHNMTDLELQYPFESLMLNQVGRTFLQSYVGGNLGAVGGLMFKTGAAEPAPQPAPGPARAETQPDTKAEIAALKAELDAMKKDLKRSQDQIDQLKKRKKG
jgi:hypothetical protein